MAPQQAHPPRLQRALSDGQAASAHMYQQQQQFVPGHPSAYNGKL